MIEDPISMNLLIGDNGGAMADHCGTIFHNLNLLNGIYIIYSTSKLRVIVIMFFFSC
jgi:hypothetical protein